MCPNLFSPPCEDSGGSVSLPDRASSTPNADKDLELGSIESACVDSSDELTILGVEFTASCPVVGNPEPTAEWKSKACAFLTELIKKNVGPKISGLIKLNLPTCRLSSFVTKLQVMVIAYSGP